MTASQVKKDIRIPEGQTDLGFQWRLGNCDDELVGRKTRGICHLGQRISQQNTLHRENKT